MHAFETLSFEEYGDGIGSAATVLRANATACGLSATVPTCPDWTVADLVVHQGMVHRWATDQLRAAPGSGPVGDPAAHEADGRGVEDLLDWFDDGATALLDAFAKTESDWDGWFFLRTGDGQPPAAPRDGWARRQCHETTIHAVDAMAARLRRAPRPDEVWFSPALAADGIDELLLGFLPRTKSPLRSADPLVIEIVATDQDHSWTVEVSEDAPRTWRGPAPAAGASGSADLDHEQRPDTTWSGPARDLYLHLWNRLGSGEGESRIRDNQHTARGEQAASLWRELMKVTW